jgi:hypothetical protein
MSVVPRNGNVQVALSFLGTMEHAVQIASLPVLSSLCLVGMLNHRSVISTVTCKADAPISSASYNREMENFSPSLVLYPQMMYLTSI